MVENEKKQEATRGVEVIKYLGSMNFFM